MIPLVVRALRALRRSHGCSETQARGEGRKAQDREDERAPEDAREALKRRQRVLSLGRGRPSGRPFCFSADRGRTGGGNP